MLIGVVANEGYSIVGEVLRGARLPDDINHRACNSVIRTILADYFGTADELNDILLDAVVGFYLGDPARPKITDNNFLRRRLVDAIWDAWLAAPTHDKALRHSSKPTDALICYIIRLQSSNP